MKIEKGRIINDYIGRNRRQFIIPVYQRNYEWSKDQCTKLFEDIVLVSNKDNKVHFCGSIATKSLNDDANISTYVIIDGQQRLTTIYILLKSLLDCSSDEKVINYLNDLLFNNNKYDDYTIDQQSKLKLKPIKADNEQLLLLMSNEYESIDKTSGIWKNYEIFKNLINDELARGTSIRQIAEGIEKLLCAQIILEDDDNAQEVFDRINSTGLPLSLPDKIRNFVLMTEATQEKLYEDYWLPTEKLFTTRELNVFFVDYINYKSNTPIKESDAYDKFREYYSNDKHNNETVLKDIYHFAKLYHNFIYADCKEYSETTNYYLNSLHRIRQTTIFTFLFDVFTDFENNVFDEYELDKILHFFLGYSVKRGICEIGSNSLRGLYRTLYSRIFINDENKAHYYDAIVSFFEQMNTKDSIPSDDLFINDLKERNLYPKKDFCKYILSTIENDVKDEDTKLLKKKKEQLFTDSLSIEHVMPQNENVSPAWRTMLGENWQYVHDKYLHTLGNLTITGYNSELGDKTYPEKQQMMDDIDAKAVLLNKEINENDTWDENTITDRAERLAKIVFDLYDYEKPNTQISFVDSSYHEYGCEDENDALYKKPNYFIFQDEIINVNSFAEIKDIMIDKLYSINPLIIEQMAKNNEKIFEDAEWAMFSYDKDKVKHRYALKTVKNSNIYVSSNFSSATIIVIIQKLLNKYDIDFSDFAYSAKNSDETESVFLRWAKDKSAKGIILLDINKCNKNYIRFTTDKMSKYLKDTDEANSSWNTKNHYFYEIKIRSSKYNFKFCINSVNASNENIERFRILNDLCENNNLKSGWIWKTLYSIPSVNYEDIDDDQINELLDKDLKQLLDFEDKILSKIQ